MPFLRQSQIQKHTPKEIKFSDLYKNSLNKKDLSSADRIKAVKALGSAGYSSSDASKILSEKNLPVEKIKEIATKLSNVGADGFNQNPYKLVNQYLKKEAIKKKNLAGRRREFMMESLQEDIYQSKTPKATTGDKKNSANKPILKF